MKILAIAIYTKKQKKSRMLYSLTFEQDNKDLQIAIENIKSHKTHCIHSICPSLDDDRILYYEPNKWDTYLFITDVVISSHTAKKIINDIKLNQDEDFPTLVIEIENHYSKIMECSTTKITSIQNLATETKQIALEGVEKILQRQEKIEVVQKKLDVIMAEPVSFKTKAFQANKKNVNKLNLFSLFNLLNSKPNVKVDEPFNFLRLKT